MKLFTVAILSLYAGSSLAYFNCVKMQDGYGRCVGNGRHQGKWQSCSKDYPCYQNTNGCTPNLAAGQQTSTEWKANCSWQ
ncbi:hypothetical protein Ptr902_13143 [Pyrenophora tritici-repentis]|nr:hypothetical protein Ptr902_13143 [Pyrenophora tritici-repentis]